MNSTGNTILITGGATGIGFALAQRLVTTGNTVIACGRSQDFLSSAAAKLPGLITRQCDVTVDADRSDLIAWLLDTYPGFNVLINNAGIQQSLDFASSVPDDRAVVAEIETNLTAPILLTSALLPHLRAQQSATVINVSSGLAFCPIAVMPVYCATKAALHSFTLSLRHQLRDTSVRVVEIVPPMVDTALNPSGRSADTGAPFMIAVDEFADDALPQLAQGEVEIVVGRARGLKEGREGMFRLLNG